MRKNGKNTLRFEVKIRRTNVPDAELINDLKRAARRLGKDRVTTNEYDALGEFSPGTLTRRFGSWFRALEKAGLKRTRNLGISDKEFLSNIEEVWVKLGRQPTYEEMWRPLSKYSAPGYVYRFGSWREALERFARYKNGRGKGKQRSAGKVVVKLSGRKTKRKLSHALRLMVLKRDGFRCRLCGRSPATDLKTVLHVDHIKPWSAGGETEPENLQTLCLECNMGKGKQRL
jgi:hypothetical protein